MATTEKMHTGKAKAPSYSDIFAIVKTPLSKNVDMLIRKAQDGGRLFDAVNTSLGEALGKTRGTAYEACLMRVSDKTKEMRKDIREHIWKSQDLATRAAVFIDDFILADVLTFLSSPEHTYATKVLRLTFYSSQIAEKSSSAQTYRGNFSALKDRVGDLPTTFKGEIDGAKVNAQDNDKPTMEAITKAESKMETFDQVATAARVIAGTATLFVGPVGWGIAAGGFAISLVCTNRRLAAQKEKKQLETRFEPYWKAVDEALALCKKNFEEIGAELEEFVNVWRLAGTLLHKLQTKLEILQPEDLERLPVRFEGLRTTFFDLRGNLEKYSAANLMC